MGILDCIQTPIETFPYGMVIGKTCHLQLELVNKAYWFIKKLNLDAELADRNRTTQLYEL